MEHFKDSSKMELIKTNILQVSLIETALANNFTCIEEEFQSLRQQIRDLQTENSKLSEKM